MQLLQSQSLWRRLQAQALRLFMRLFPWLHATQEGLQFGYQLLYLLDSSAFYTPILHLLGQNIVRVSGQEMVSLVCEDTCTVNHCTSRQGGLQSALLPCRQLCPFC